MSSITKDLQILAGRGISLTVKNGSLSLKTKNKELVTDKMRKWCADHKEEIMQLLMQDEVRSEPAQPAPAPAGQCCRCDLPVEHYSPSGDAYCTEHYMCAGGHPPRWVKHDGLWLCECVANRMPEKKVAGAA